jgi:hypothetical protein
MSGQCAVALPLELEDRGHRSQRNLERYDVTEQRLYLRLAELADQQRLWVGRLHNIEQSLDVVNRFRLTKKPRHSVTVTGDMVPHRYGAAFRRIRKEGVMR